jgi:hypothetical protein
VETQLVYRNARFVVKFQARAMLLFVFCWKDRRGVQFMSNPKAIAVLALATAAVLYATGHLGLGIAGTVTSLVCFFVPRREVSGHIDDT